MSHLRFSCSRRKLRLMDCSSISLIYFQVLNDSLAFHGSVRLISAQLWYMCNWSYFSINISKMTNRFKCHNTKPALYNNDVQFILNLKHRGQGFFFRVSFHIWVTFYDSQFKTVIFNEAPPFTHCSTLYHTSIILGLGLFYHCGCKIIRWFSSFRDHFFCSPVWLRSYSNVKLIFPWMLCAYLPKARLLFFLLLSVI